jgi:hypothetical protein
VFRVLTWIGKKLTGYGKGNIKDNFFNTTENDEAQLIWGKVLHF